LGWVNLSLLEAQEYTLNQLLSNTQFAYRVPLYQRPYAWEEDQWKELYDDIKNLGNDNSHFLGSFVLVPDPEKIGKGLDYFHIVDGQQRLATILIWLSVIRDIASNVQEEGIASHIENTFLFSRELRENKRVKIPKLKLGILDGDAFNRVLENKKKEYEHLIFDCYNFFRERTTTDDIWPLIDQVSIVSINTHNYFNAFRLFETMNDRGLELSAADLIKNYILMNVSDNSQIFDNTVSEWNEMYEKVRDLEPVTFIRRYFLSNYKGVTSEARLYEELKNKFDDKSPDQILDFVKKLNYNAEIYNKIFEANFSSDELNEKLEKLRLVEVAPSYTLLLKILPLYIDGKVSDRDIIDVMDLIENFHIRWGMCDVSTNRLNPIYNELCMEIPKLDPKYIVDHIKRTFTTNIARNADDSLFKKSFTSKNLTGSQKRTKYILWRLSIPTGETNLNLNQIQTEHIMPQRLSNQWIQYLKEDTKLSDEEIRAIKKDKSNLIGNLTIIKGDWNQRMSNRPFEEKKESYAQSEFDLNQDLVNNYDEWNFDTIDRRGEYLADLALTVWPWDYSKTKVTNRRFWITSIKDKENLSKEERLYNLVGKGRYVFSDNTPGRKQIKPGDYICFYLKEVGVAATAEVTSYPDNDPKNIIEKYEAYPWFFKLKNVEIFLDNPIIINKESKNKLKWFEDKDPNYTIGLFLSWTHDLPEQDFKMLTENKQDTQTPLSF